MMPLPIFMLEDDEGGDLEEHANNASTVKVPRQSCSLVEKVGRPVNRKNMTYSTASLVNDMDRVGFQHNLYSYTSKGKSVWD